MGKLHWKMHYVQIFYFPQYVVNALLSSHAALDLHIPCAQQSVCAIKRLCIKTSPPPIFSKCQNCQLCYLISPGGYALSTCGLKHKLPRYPHTRIRNKLKHEKFFPKGPPSDHPKTLSTLSPHISRRVRTQHVRFET
jgi:hypothetical protein